MGIHKLLERWGFVRLRDFGLILTEERRLLTTRRAVLDDGFGGCVVGWTDGDLAAMELARWGTQQPPTASSSPRPVPVALKARAVPVAAPAPIVVPAPIAVPVPIPIAEPVAIATPVAIAAPVVIAAPPAAEPEADPDEMTEDEWEWEIAVARARGDAGPTPIEREPIQPPPSMPRRSQPSAQWLTAEPPAWSDDDPAVRPATQLARSSAQVITDAARPRTIIPVPSLPVAVDPRLVRPLDHTPTRLPPAPHRYPRATNQHLAAPPDDDHTSPTVVSLPARTRQTARR